MSGTKYTIALGATVRSPETYPIEAGETIRVITPASSTAKLEISYDGGATWKNWAFGTQAQSLTKNEVLLKRCLVRATCVTGTATFEADLAASTEAHARVMIGTGTPASLVAAAPGTMFLAIGGGAATTLYIKGSGTDATGWLAVTGA